MLAAAAIVAVTAALAPSLPQARPKLLIVDLEVRSGADPDLQASTTHLVVSAMTHAARFDVLAGDDVRRTLALAAERQRTGCDSTACLDEIAGALGAELVVFGDLTTLGDETLLTLNLFDTRAVQSIVRVTAPLERSHRRDVVERLAKDVVHAYDQSRGAFPVGAVAVGGGAVGVVGGLAVVGVGVWQLSLLVDDGARHDRLLRDYEKTRDAALVDDAQLVQRAADEHALAGNVAVVAGAALVVAGAAVAALGFVE